MSNDWTTEEKLTLAMQRVRQLDSEIIRRDEQTRKLCEHMRHTLRCMTCAYDPKMCGEGMEALIWLTETEMKVGLGAAVESESAPDAEGARSCPAHYIGEQNVDPLGVIQAMVQTAQEALTPNDQAHA